MHNSSSGTSQCPLAVLAASPVPFICTPPSVARPRRSPLVRPRAPHGTPRVLFRVGGVVLVFVSACLPCAVSCRVSLVMWLACLCRVLSLAVRMVRAARLVLWCRDPPSGVAGLVRRNTSAPAGRGQRDRRSSVVSLWSLACSLRVFGEKEYWAVLTPPFRFLTPLAFCVSVSLVPFLQVARAESPPASQAFNLP